MLYRGVFLNKEACLSFQDFVFETFKNREGFGEGIWTKLGGNSSYKLPGASHTAPGPYILQGSEKMTERFVSNKSKNRNFWTWTSVSGPLEPVLGRKFDVESESEVQLLCFRAPTPKT